MKEVMRVLWVVSVQYIACWFSGWDAASTFFMLVVLFLWQMIFTYINHHLSRRKEGDSRDVSSLIYLLCSFPALFSPLISMLIFIGLTVFRVCTIGGVTVGAKSLKEQFTFDGAYIGQSDTDCSEPMRSNPATGLPMCGVVDSSGNAYGSSIRVDSHYH